uniref:Uncharacterized protein n=1 Tax=Arundo donax TaxID=35708 RepID=A0A0A9EXC1_ARUDO
MIRYLHLRTTYSRTTVSSQMVESNLLQNLFFLLYYNNYQGTNIYLSHLFNESCKYSIDLHNNSFLM